MGRKSFRGNAGALFVALLIAAAMAPLARAQTSYAENAGRLKTMKPEEKEELRRKKARFDELGAEEQQRLRELHQSITSDANSQELIETVTRYSRWLASVDPAERAALQGIEEPDKRIARIKEIIQQQEERRFRSYLANLPEEDRKTIYAWLGEFVTAHENEIRQRMPSFIRQRVDDAPDEEAKRRELIRHWQRNPRDSGLLPDYDELFKKFTPETQKTIEAAAAAKLANEPAEHRTAERQKEIEREQMTELVRMALWARFFTPVSTDELLKFYNAMKPDDSRRRLLEGKDSDELRRELQRMYNMEHGGGRGFGPPGSRLGPPGGWPGPPGRGGKGPPGERRPPGESPPADAKPADSKQP